MKPLHFTLELSIPVTAIAENNKMIVEWQIRPDNGYDSELFRRNLKLNMVGF